MALPRERNLAVPRAIYFANAVKRTRPTVRGAPVAQLTATHFAEINADCTTSTWRASRVRLPGPPLIQEQLFERLLHRLHRNNLPTSFSQRRQHAFNFIL